MTDSAILKRSDAIAMLNVAIKACVGRTGPGAWLVRDDYPWLEAPPRPVVLEYCWPSARLPQDQQSDAPWNLWGGERIIAAIGARCRENYCFPDSLSILHCIFLVEVRD